MKRVLVKSHLEQVIEPDSKTKNISFITNGCIMNKHAVELYSSRFGAEKFLKLYDDIRIITDDEGLKLITELRLTIKNKNNA